MNKQEQLLNRLSDYQKKVLTQISVSTGLGNDDDCKALGYLALEDFKAIRQALEAQMWREDTALTNCPDTATIDK